jgi:hypothetical protein
VCSSDLGEQVLAEVPGQRLDGRHPAAARVARRHQENYGLLRLIAVNVI